MQELPCEFCPVFAICYSKVCQARVNIYGVVYNCSILKDFLKVEGISQVSMTWSCTSKIPVDKLKSLAYKFKFQYSYLYNGWVRTYKDGWI